MKLTIELQKASLIFPSLLSFCLATSSLQYLGTTALGPDPKTTNRLNGESFQQDGLVTFHGFQYGAFWQTSPSNASVRHATIARRSLASGSSVFESFSLSDYNQTEDDGHDIISIGISPTDGTLHLIFDQHDNPLHYRATIPGVATNPSIVKWTADIFKPITDFLPGLEALDKFTHFINITYPRFLIIPPDAQGFKSPSKSQGLPDLLLELRVGRSGLGDDWIYHYYPGKGGDSSSNGNSAPGRWQLVGRYLLGVNNNAYINGLDFDSHGNLHATWTYRDFINDTGKDVAVQAGPNGPENNHDLNYAFSPDLGFTWLNTWGQTTANLKAGSDSTFSETASTVEPGSPIQPNSAGIIIFGIPKFGGILNQESQTVDSAGRIHVLNRENTTGVERWYHYWRAPGVPAQWTRTPFPLSVDSDANNVTATPTVIGKRGKLAAIPGPSAGESRLLAILPSNAPNSTAITILESTSRRQFRDWTVAWQAPSGCGWEPLFDRYRLVDGILSLYLVNGTNVSVTDVNIL